MDEVEAYIASIAGLATPSVPTKNVVQGRAHYGTYYAEAGLVNLVGDLYRLDVDLFDYDFGT